MNKIEKAYSDAHAERLAYARENQLEIEKAEIKRLREAAVATRETFDGLEYKRMCDIIDAICDRALAEARGWKDGVPDALKIKEPEAKPEMVVCENAERCLESCIGKEAHKHNFMCDKVCSLNGGKFKCIPVAKVE